MHFDNFSPTPSLPRYYPPTYSSNLMFFRKPKPKSKTELRKTTTKNEKWQSKRTNLKKRKINKTKIPKQNKAKIIWEKTHKTMGNLEPTYGGQLFLDMGLAQECGWYTWWHSIGENWYLLSQQVAITNSSLVRSGTLCSLPLLSAGTWSGLTLYWSRACCHSLCAFYVCWSYGFQEMLFPWSCPQPLTFIIYLP